MVGINTPANQKPLLDSVKLLQNQGEKQEALLLIKKAVKRYPKDVNTAVLAGLLYQDSDQPKFAEKSFRHALSIDSTNPEVLKSLGLFIITQHKKHAYITRTANKSEDGVECTLNPRNPYKSEEGVDFLIKYLQVIKWNELAVLKIVSNNVSDKEKLLPILKDAWETTLSPEIGYLYTQNLKWFDEYENAIPILQLLVKHSPNPEIFNDLADYYKELKQFEKAIPYYQKAIDLSKSAFKKGKETIADDDDLQDSYLSSSYNDLSNCYREIGKKELALKAASRAVDLNPTLGDNWTAWLEILMDMERYQEAAEVAEHALEAEAAEEFFGFGGPDEAEEFQLTVAKSLEKGGQPDAAIKTLVDGVEHAYGKSEFYFEAARILFSQGRTDEAFGYFERMFQTTREPWRDRLSHLFTYIDYLRKVGQGDIVWKNIDQFIKEEDKGLIGIAAFAYLRHDLVSDESDATRKFVDGTIEYISKNLSKDPIAIEALLEVRFQQGRLDDCVDILNHAIKAPIGNKFRLEFLNNLGFIHLCKGNLGKAEKLLTRALTLAKEKPDLGASFSLLGLTFFVDGEILPYPRTDKSKVKSNLIKPSGKLDKIIDAVKINLVSLALAKGDADEASNIATDILSTFNTENTFAIRDLVVLSIARFRNDIKTARSAWKQYLEHKGKNEREKLFTEGHPELYKWLNSSDIPNKA